MSAWKKFIWVLGRWIWSCGEEKPHEPNPADCPTLSQGALRDPSQPQPFWGIFDFKAVEV